MTARVRRGRPVARPPAARRHSARVRFFKRAIPLGAVGGGSSPVLLATFFNPFRRVEG